MDPTSLFSLHKTKDPVRGDANARLMKVIPEQAFKMRSETDLDPVLAALGDSRVIMIGEASHGTHEYYKIRAEITKRLILEKQLSFVAVEGDWPDVYRINRYVCGMGEDQSAREALGDFERFPLWMWRNDVVEEFIEWLKKYNDQFQDSWKKVRFYGLDMYSLFRSADLVIEYLQKVDPEDAKLARKRYGTLNRYREDEHSYGVDVMRKRTPSREKEVLDMLVMMMNKGSEYLRKGGFIDGDELFFNQQNAVVVKDAEEYYRKSMYGGATTWNIRDKHMLDTLLALLNMHDSKTGRRSKAAVWAHNSHLGDARATEYSRESGEWNLGQLVRQHIGKEDSFNIGFTSYTGTVTAAPEWGEPARKFNLTPAFEDSYEALFHKALPGNWTITLRSNNKDIKPDSVMVKLLSLERTERMVGVQYVKYAERQAHYVPAILPQQFDAVIHWDVTKALQPLDMDSSE